MNIVRGCFRRDQTNLASIQIIQMNPMNPHLSLRNSCSVQFLVGKIDIHLHFLLVNHGKSENAHSLDVDQEPDVHINHVFWGHDLIG